MSESIEGKTAVLQSQLGELETSVTEIKGQYSALREEVSTKARGEKPHPWPLPPDPPIYRWS